MTITLIKRRMSSQHPSYQNIPKSATVLIDRGDVEPCKSKINWTKERSDGKFLAGISYPDGFCSIWILDFDLRNNEWKAVECALYPGGQRLDVSEVKLIKRKG